MCGVCVCVNINTTVVMKASNIRGCQIRDVCLIYFIPERIANGLWLEWGQTEEEPTGAISSS